MATPTTARVDQFPGSTKLSSAPDRHPLRLEIDLLRGLLMILIALDHTRDFFFNPPTIDASRGLV